VSLQRVVVVASGLGGISYGEALAGQRGATASTAASSSPVSP